MKYVARPRESKRPGMHTVARIIDGELNDVASMPLPDRVEIEPEAGSDHYFMYRYTKAGEFCGDTWHEDLDAAFEQAHFEYGLIKTDFLVVHEGAA